MNAHGGVANVRLQPVLDRSFCLFFFVNVALWPALENMHRFQFDNCPGYVSYKGQLVHVSVHCASRAN